MKKVAIFAATVVATMILSGCGGNHTDVVYVEPEPPSALTTLFLIDGNGYSIGGVDYYCDTLGAGTTLGNGEFSFYPGDYCTFDFIGFYEYFGGPNKEDEIRIVDDLGHGKGDIPYVCDSGISDLTFPNGSFDHGTDDICTFDFSGWI